MNGRDDFYAFAERRHDERSIAVLHHADPFEVSTWRHDRRCARHDPRIAVRALDPMLACICRLGDDRFCPLLANSSAIVGVNRVEPAPIVGVQLVAGKAMPAIGFEFDAPIGVSCQTSDNDVSASVRNRRAFTLAASAVAFAL